MKPSPLCTLLVGLLLGIAFVNHASALKCRVKLVPSSITATRVGGVTSLEGTPLPGETARWASTATGVSTVHDNRRRVTLTALFDGKDVVAEIDQ